MKIVAMNAVPRMMVVALGLAFSGLAAAANVPSPCNGPTYNEFQCSAYPDTYRMVVSAKTVESLSAGSVSSGSAAIRMTYDSSDATMGYANTTNYWNQDWSLYLSPNSALGPYGPLGAYGPVSSVGPLFNGSLGGFYSAASWYSGGFANIFQTGSSTIGIYGPSVDWTQIPANNDLSSSGMLSNAGPLGSTGPLTEYNLYTAMYHLNENLPVVFGFPCSDNQKDGNCDYNDFPHHLDPSGVWGILGPIGPTGPLGPLGPLGKLGVGKLTTATYLGVGTVFSVDSDGQYQQAPVANPAAKSVKRTIIVPQTAGAYRRYPLVEMYNKSFLLSPPMGFVNDTSFSVDASGSVNAAGDEFPMSSNFDQFVSATVTPVNLYGEFKLEVLRFKNGAWENIYAGDNKSAFSGGFTNGFVDFVMFRAKDGESLKIKVTPADNSAATNFGYLLHVTGSGFEEGPMNAFSKTANKALFDPRAKIYSPACSPWSCPYRLKFNTKGSHQNFQQAF